MPAAPLRIRLLGGFSVETDGGLVDERAWRLRKARALVKVAALAPGRRVHRDVRRHRFRGPGRAMAEIDAQGHGGAGYPGHRSGSRMTDPGRDIGRIERADCGACPSDPGPSSRS